MSGDHNEYQKDRSYLDFECPRCGHCCYVDDDDTSQEFDCTDEQLIEEVRRRGFVIRDAQIEVPKQWVGLTDEEVSYFRYAATFCDELDTAYMAELIEKDLKEKNT